MSFIFTLLGLQIWVIVLAVVLVSPFIFLIVVFVDWICFRYPTLRDIIEGSERFQSIAKQYPEMDTNHLKLGPVRKGTEDQISKLDSAIFQKENEYGDWVVRFAERWPLFMHVLYDDRGTPSARGFLDMFTFKPDTFVNVARICPKVQEGKLPEPQDIYNSPDIMYPGLQTEGKVVDVYVDAFAVILGEGRYSQAVILLHQFAELVKNNRLLGELRINQIALVAVANKGEDIGKIWAKNLGFTLRAEGLCPASGLRRAFYTLIFRRDFWPICKEKGRKLIPWSIRQLFATTIDAFK